MIQLLKTGVVVEANKEFTYIMTCDCEFFNLRTKNNKPPHIGEMFTGELYVKGKVFYKLIFLAVISSLVIYGLINTIYKNTVAYSVVVDINSSIQFKVNKSNEVLKVMPLSVKGADLTKDLNLKNKTLDIALTMLLEKSHKLKYLDNFYSKKDNPIHLYMTAHNNTLIPLTAFKHKADELKITLQINDNGELSNLYK
ncbi:MAG: hypothetical protein H7Y18_16570 [Clostridiaceae bacterium]|nr:hypothetical protein [Clostridiaceae bacterium]